MEPADATSLDRPLRLLTCLATAICVPLNIAATALSLERQHQRWARRHVTAFCFVYIPLVVTAISAILNLQYMKRRGKTPSAVYFTVLDVVAAAGYFSTLVPCWALEIREFNAGGFGLLTGYVTAPMILNLFIHSYFVLRNVPWKKVISSIRISSKSSCQQCPNCQAKFISGSTPPMTSKGYSLLRGEDYLDIEADPIQYRDSEDFLGEGAERAERPEQPEQPEQPERPEQSEQPQQAAAAEDNGKGKDMMV